MVFFGCFLFLWERMSADTGRLGNWDHGHDRLCSFHQLDSPPPTSTLTIYHDTHTPCITDSGGLVFGIAASGFLLTLLFIFLHRSLSFPYLLHYPDCLPPHC
ncbi:hypothetical protein VTJ04DRAFT_9138 [Mycothermus thermophilus]|uniref:uncharacterized protein n=1 Tax=Humicola insolens TaxID=85995 RepID=UPI0037443003